jgi:hypothetical protein
MGRDRAIARLRARLLRLEQPRLLMALIVALTGAAGFLTSAGLLQLGLRRMWLRYGVALVTAYLCFLLFVWLWALYRRRELRDDADRRERRDEADARTGSRSESGRSPGDAPDLTLGIDGDEGVLILVVLLIVGAVLIASIYVIAIAPTLLAEVLLDAALSAGLYRRLRGADQAHWLASVVKRTWLAAVCVLVALIIGGAVMQQLAPEASTLGETIRQVGG